ncbi:MAG: DUF6514 family protein [Defluviitaleaceae bacterium]|nr:DUF6514 family protein [Defluviitaleaceae bacterium]
MSKGILISEAKLKDENSNIYKMGYYVLPFGLDGDQAAYGIRIEKTDVKGNTSAEETGGLTHSYDEAEGWVRRLAAGEVTPFTLHDVVDDLMVA